MKPPPLRRLLETPSFRALMALALVVAIGCVFNSNGAFFHWSTHRDMLRQVSVYGILACGMTLVIISGGIDLSVGSVLGLCAVLFARQTLHEGQDPWVALALVLGAGAAIGLVSGTLVARFRIQPFVATLAMMVFARGLAKWISGGQKISEAIQQPDGTFTYVDVPAIFGRIDARILHGNLSVVTLVFLGCVLLSWLVLSKLRYGRYLYAAGGNEEAARLSGVPLVSTRLLAYGLSGLFGAVAGICQAAQEQQGDPEAGTTYELTAIAIAVIGGNNLMGGRGGIGLTLLGALTIGYLDKILSINAVGESSRLMLTGGIIVAAVLLQRRRAA
jgi:ribose transport system permease protein